MTPERWQHVKDILEAAWERDASERNSFLDQACDGDAELRSHVEALLASDEDGGEFLASPAMDLVEIGGAALSSVVQQLPKNYSQLGAYKILGRIGAGGMGEVYRAVDVTLGREVALKVLPDGTAQDPHRLERFHREARAVAALNHPNIVTLYSVEQFEGIHFLTMELVEGQTLQELIVAEGLPIDRIIEIALPLADALAAAHDKGLIHRDLKPANIMITHTGRLKVLDFGVAKFLDTTSPAGAPITSLTDTQAGVVIGTPAYMSPEQISGRVLDHRTDIFSLGIILYELATGRRPFHGLTTLEVAASILRDPPQPVSPASSGLPVEFTELIWHCLEKDPARRIQTARVLASALQQMKPRGTSYGSRPASSAPLGDEGFWIAVLPFRHSGEDPSIEALAEGIAEGIITGLSRFSYLRVISQASTLKYAGGAGDLRANAKELGARYVMEGSIRKAGWNCRLAVQLSDIITATHLWAETFDRPFRPDDIFALQDQLIPRIVSTVADQNGVLPQTMSNILARRGSGPFSPYEACLRAFRHFVNLKPQEHAEVRAILEAAIAVAPDHSDCLALLSILSCSEFLHGFNPRPDPLGRAIRDARLAVESGPANHLAHTALAYTLYMQKDLPAFRPAAERSLELNRMDGSTAAFLGMLIAYSGDWDHGCAVLERAMQLNPNHPRWYYCGLFYNAYRKRDYPAALEIAFRIDMPGNFYNFMRKACAFGQLGQEESARQAIDSMLAIRPGLASEAALHEELSKWYQDDFVEHLIEGLRKAGFGEPDPEA